MTQTSREKRMYVQKVANDTVASATWTVTPVVGTPSDPAVTESQSETSTQTQIMLSGLKAGCQYELRPVITGASGQVYEPDPPYYVRCDR